MCTLSSNVFIVFWRLAFSHDSPDRKKGTSQLVLLGEDYILYIYIYFNLVLSALVHINLDQIRLSWRNVVQEKVVGQQSQPA